MRKPLLASLLLLLFATPVRAGILTSASLLVEVGNFPAVSFPATGAVAGAPSNTQVFLGAGSAFSGSVTPLTPSPTPPITGLEFTMALNQGGSFSGTTPGNLAGEARFPVGLCIESYGGLCFLDFAIPFGTSTTLVELVGPAVAGTYYANEWTAGTVTVVLTTPTSQGATLATRQGSNGLDALGRGSLVLVSSVNIVTGAAGQFPAFATLTLDFVPEPGTALLLLAGAAALIARSNRLR